MTWSTPMEIIGLLAMALMLFVMGMLSRKIGRVTRMTPYFFGFFVASALLMIGALVRLVPLLDAISFSEDLTQNVLWVLLYNGTPALGVTIGAIVGWRYWSWLLAERG